MRGLVRSVAVVATAFLASCTPPAQYVSSDLETYQVIAPEYIALVNTASSLTLEEKVRRARSVDAWRIRVDRALGTTTPQLPLVKELLPIVPASQPTR